MCKRFQWFDVIFMTRSEVNCQMTDIRRLIRWQTKKMSKLMSNSWMRNRHFCPHFEFALFFMFSLSNRLASHTPTNKQNLKFLCQTHECGCRRIVSILLVHRSADPKMDTAQTKTQKSHRNRLTSFDAKYSLCQTVNERNEINFFSFSGRFRNDNEFCVEYS